jgi:hypothetical protein
LLFWRMRCGGGVFDVVFKTCCRMHAALYCHSVVVIGKGVAWYAMVGCCGCCE